MLISRITGCLVLGLFLAVSSPANASLIVWTLKNVVFSDSGTASGTFTVDSGTGDLQAIDIVTTQGNEPPNLGTFPGGTYISSTPSGVTGSGPYGFLFGSGGGGLEFDFLKPLTSNGPIAFSSSSLEDAFLIGGGLDTRNVISGFVISDPVGTAPLPSSLPLMLTGLALLALATSRRKTGPSAIFR